MQLIDRFLAESRGGARDWSVCTECGMGRVDTADIPRLLDIHSDVVSGRY